METMAFGVPGMDEEMGRLIEKRLKRVPGVQDVTVWLGEQQIDVYFDPALTSPEALAGAMQALGAIAKRIPFKDRWPG